MVTDKTTLMNEVVAGKKTGEQAIAEYLEKYGDVSAQILSELNAQ